jgi:hypothetical protein
VENYFRPNNRFPLFSISPRPPALSTCLWWTGGSASVDDHGGVPKPHLLPHILPRLLHHLLLAKGNNLEHGECINFKLVFLTGWLNTAQDTKSKTEHRKMATQYLVRFSHSCKSSKYGIFRQLAKHTKIDGLNI